MSLTAVKCCQPSICRRAISLLGEYPCQEEMWELRIFGRFAEEIANLEEAGMSDRVTSNQVIPEEFRFCYMVLAATEEMGIGGIVCARFLHENYWQVGNHRTPICYAKEVP